MAFSFNFSGEDIDESMDGGDDGVQINGAGDDGAAQASVGDEAAAAVEVKQHDLKEIVGLMFSSSFLLI